MISSHYVRASAKASNRLWLNQEPQISVVVPVYRNAETLVELRSRVRRVLEARSLTHEMLFVDDACPEDSMSILITLAKLDPNVAALSLERNVGQHQAVLVGLDYARGKHVVVMDADLQDPPEAIPELLAKLEAGYAAAFGGRQGYYESILRMLTSRVFKLVLRLLCGLPMDAGLFVAMNSEMVKQLRVLGASPSLIVMMAFTGLPLVSIPVTRIKRPRGQSAYSVLARLEFGMLTLRQALHMRLSHGPELSDHQVRVPVKAYVGTRFLQGMEDQSKRGVVASARPA